MRIIFKQVDNLKVYYAPRASLLLESDNQQYGSKNGKVGHDANHAWRGLMKLYFDESGNTGTDPLNIDQPVFALASTSLSRDACSELLAPLFTQKQSEAKYARLKGTRRGQEALLVFANSPLLNQDAFIFMQTDKLYYLLTHLVDKLIEPVHHEMGGDLYAGDAHVGLTNLFYFTGGSAFPEGHWMRILKSLALALRKLTPTSFEEFQNVVRAAAPYVPEPFSMLRAMVWAGAERIEQSLGVFRGTTTFDPAVDAFISVVNMWMARFEGDLQITHDQSKPLRHSESFLRAMMTKIPSRTIGYGTRKAELPLRVSEFTFGDSRLLPQLQVADILAGLSVDCLLAWSGKRPSNDFHQAMKATPLAQWSVRGMLPELKFDRANDPAPGEVNLVDGAVAFMKEVGYQPSRR